MAAPASACSALACCMPHNATTARNVRENHYSAGTHKRPALQYKPQRGPARGELIDRHLRRLAMGEEAVTDHRMAGRQPSTGRGLVAQADLAQPVGDAPMRRQPGQ